MAHQEPWMPARGLGRKRLLISKETRSDDL